jgi:hypothetical protein
MWTIVRFALHGAGQGYGEAFELLRRAGFHPHRTPAAGGSQDDALPAAVVADLFQDPAVVSRAIFEALHAAGLAPVTVTGSHVGVGGARDRTRALARR